MLGLNVWHSSTQPWEKGKPLNRAVAVFDDSGSASAAVSLIGETLARMDQVVVLQPASVQPHSLAHRGESMLKGAIRWGIWGSVIFELPLTLAILVAPVDINVKVLVAATVWKFGAGFGAWFGAMAAQEEGLHSDDAARYETLCSERKWIVAVPLKRRTAPSIRGILIESGAVEIRELRGSFRIKHENIKNRRLLRVARN